MLKSFGLLISLILSCPAMAQSDDNLDSECLARKQMPDRQVVDPTAFHFSGYLSQGWIKTTANNVSGDSDSKWGTFDRREAGLIGAKRLGESVDFRFHVKSFQSGDSSDGIPYLVFGLLDAHTVFGASTGGIRVGRNKITVGAQSSMRDSPTQRDMDFLPQSIYRDQLQILAANADGVQGYYHLREVEAVDIDIEATVARPIIRPQADIEGVFFEGQRPIGHLASNGSTIQVLSVALSDKRKMFRFRYDYTNLRLSYQSGGPLDQYIDSQLKMGLHYLSAQFYFLNDFDFTVEGVAGKQHGSLSDKLQTSDKTPAAFNVAVRWAKGAWTVTGAYNQFAGGIHAVPSDGIQSPRREDFMPEDHRDLNVGVKYMRGKWTYKAEVHRIQGTSSLTLMDNPNGPVSANWTLFSTSVSRSF